MYERKKRVKDGAKVYGLSNALIKILYIEK